MELIKIIERSINEKEQKEMKIEESILRLSEEIQNACVDKMIDAFESGKNLEYEIGGDWITFTLVVDLISMSILDFLEINSEEDYTKSIMSRLQKIDTDKLKQSLNCKLAEKGAPKCASLVNIRTPSEVGVFQFQVIFEIV